MISEIYGYLIIRRRLPVHPNYGDFDQSNHVQKLRVLCFPVVKELVKARHEAVGLVRTNESGALYESEDEDNKSMTCEERKRCFNLQNQLKNLPSVM
jgi:hypothetical protein